MRSGTDRTILVLAVTRGRFLRLQTQELSETTEKVHFFQNTNIVIKKRASRIASKAPFLLDDTLSTPKIFSFFVEDYFFSSLDFILLKNSGVTPI